MKLVLQLLIVTLAAALTAPLAMADDFNSDGVRIHYIVKGKGSPVILVHGLYSSALANWQIPGIVADLAKNHEVIALDCRGHGESGKPPGDDKYGTQMCEDINRLMDHLHIQKATLVGYSMGGMIVMKFLAMHPERASSAVLGGMGWLRQGSPIDRFWAGVKDAKGTVPPECLRGFSKLALSGPELGKINVPITCIVGDKDPCSFLYVMPLKAARPNTKVIMVPGAGHLNCVLQPQFKNDLVDAVGQ